MTKQRDVVMAIRALIEAALPAADVNGFDGDASIPELIGAAGAVVGFAGDPGEAQIDIGSSQPYNYEHNVQIEVAAAAAAGGMPLDDMLIAIGAGVRADRYLGGRCDWLEATAPVRQDRTSDDVTINWAELTIVAHYSTEDPLA